jgi:hypothetical protein
MAAFNFHRRKTRRWWYVGATLVAAALFAVFYVAGAGAVVSGSPSGFESSDGDMVLTDTSSGGSTDWNCFLGTSNFQGGTPNAKCAVKSGAIEDTNSAAGTGSDPSWVNGQKFDALCASVTTGQNQDKDTFNNIAQYNETATNNHLFLYGATIRRTANGNANENVELSQNAGTAACPINRTDGDKLLQFNFGGSNAAPSLQVLTYYITTALPSGVSCFNTATHSRPCWANPQSVGSNSLEGNVNGSAIVPGANGMSGSNVVALAFAEFGVDLTNALGLSTTSCTTFGQETWESRSSSSFSSNPSAIQIIPHSISNCGTITIVKQTDPRHIDKDFTFTPAGGTPTLGGGTTFTLNDKTGGTNTKVYSNVLHGSYSVTESDPGSGWGLESLSCSPSAADTTGSVGVQHAAGSRQADITLGAGGAVTCTFQNQQQTGTVIIRKVVSPNNSTPSFGFTDNLVTAPAATNSPFSLNDGGNKEFDNVLATTGSGTYTVTENDPSSAHYALTGIDCSASNYTTGITTSTSSRNVVFSLPIGKTLDCTFTNTLQTGALVIRKESTKTNNPLVGQLNSGTTVGASFCYSTTTGCTSSTGSQVTDNGTGDSDSTYGVACVPGVVVGTYKVNETAAPSGFGSSTSGEQTATVVSGTDCSSNEPTLTSNSSSVAQFTDPPLTDVTVEAKSETAGGTKSTITCKGPSPSTSTVGTGGSLAEDSKVTANGLAPGTYTCTVVVDP